MGHYDDRREQEYENHRTMVLSFFLQEVKRGKYDCIVDTAERMNIDHTLVHLPVLRKMIELIKKIP